MTSETHGTTSAVGVFRSLETAKAAVSKLFAGGTARERVFLLTPDASLAALETVPSTEGEQPGMGTAVGAVVGGAAGASAGWQLAAVASLFIPGLGTLGAVGLAAAGLLGVGGILAGAAVGTALEQSLSQGLPKDELFLYEDALRQGRSIVIVLADGEPEADRARTILAEAGAESIDAAREAWWIGLRDVEKARYTEQGWDFERDETSYRRGFEAALHAQVRGSSYDQAGNYLRSRYPDIYREPAFQRGYERGRLHHTGTIAEASETRRPRVSSARR
jgi:hypothetical protein